MNAQEADDTLYEARAKLYPDQEAALDFLISEARKLEWVREWWWYPEKLREMFAADAKEEGSK